MEDITLYEQRKLRPTEPERRRPQKLPVRIVPPLLAERAEGRMPGRRHHRHRGLDLAPAATVPSQRSRRRSRLLGSQRTDEPTAVSGVLETLYSGLGEDSALVRVIIEQMDAPQAAMIMLQYGWG